MNTSRTQYGSQTLDMSRDEGLRKFMLGVYNKLGLGLLVAAVLAFLTSGYAPVRDMMFVVENGRFAGMTPLGMVVQWSPLVALLGTMFFMRNPSPRAAGALYWFVVATIGAGLGVWLLIYTSQSVAQTFVITSAAFFGLSLFGYTTKMDLRPIGTFLIMGVIGLILASLVNFFLQSSALMFAISGLGVLIFSGLIAFDTQRLKHQYYELGGNESAMSVATSYGALSLFINFINLFQFLLMFLGQRE